MTQAPIPAGGAVEAGEEDPHTFSFVMPSLRKRSTARLEASLKYWLAQDCECDSYHGFTCGKHRTIDELRWALNARAARALPLTSKEDR